MRVACLGGLTAGALLCGCVSQTGGTGGDAAADAEAHAVVIDSVAPYTFGEPMFEAVGIVAKHLGAPHSPAYIQGISGAAFRIAGICPCAPTCDAEMEPAELARMLGFTVTVTDMGAACADYGDLRPLAEAYRKNGNVIPEPEALADEALQEHARRVHTVIDAVKDAVRSGTPVVVWHAFTNAEFDVVTGYDAQTGEFLGRGSYNNPADGSYARAPAGRMVETAYIGGLPSAIVLSKPVKRFDARAAELAALRAAVRHGRSRENADTTNDAEWRMLHGIACYDRWVREWQDPNKKRQSGDSYCLGVYGKTHAAAGPFLREIAPKYPKTAAKLEQAATCFEAEAATLERCRPLIGWSAPEGPDPERNRKTAELFGTARDQYAEGIAAIEDALTRME